MDFGALGYGFFIQLRNDIMLSGSKDQTSGKRIPNVLELLYRLSFCGAGRSSMPFLQAS